jgi:ABC-type antimicrobial peptide transport system permease subunit
VLSSQLEQAYPAENKNQLLTAQKLARVSVSTSPQTDGGVGTSFGMLMGMAAIVLVVACLNLANMMLARGTARRKEIAMRLALGGGRRRIIRRRVRTPARLLGREPAGGNIAAALASPTGVRLEP